jgi:hypothetical protein
VKAYQGWLAKAQWITKELTGIPGVHPSLDYQSTVEEDEPVVPLSVIKMDEKVTGITGVQLMEKLREGDPSIETLYEPAFLLKNPDGKLVINPEFLLEGEKETVVKEIKKILKGSRK